MPSLRAAILGGVGTASHLIPATEGTSRTICNNVSVGVWIPLDAGWSWTMRGRPASPTRRKYGTLFVSADATMAADAPSRFASLIAAIVAAVPARDAPTITGTGPAASIVARTAARPPSLPGPGGF